MASTENGDDETILAKWLSVDNHVHDEHEHASPKFRNCVHGHLSKRKWFKRRKYSVCVCICVSERVHVCSTQIPSQVRCYQL